MRCHGELESTEKDEAAETEADRRMDSEKAMRTRAEASDEGDVQVEVE